MDNISYSYQRGANMVCLMFTYLIFVDKFHAIAYTVLLSTKNAETNILTHYAVNPACREIDIHGWYSQAKINFTLKREKTIDEYDVTIPVHRICVTSRVNCVVMSQC